jgi:hypothetical protein
MTTEQKALRAAAGVALIAFGLITALGAYPPLSAPVGLFADLMAWPLDGTRPNPTSETRVLIAILGGITLGWGVMIWNLAGAPLARDPGLIRPIIRNAILAWFVVDSTASVLAGAPLNAVANVALAALFLVPLHLGARQTAALA